MLNNPPIPYYFCVVVPISRLLTVGSTPVQLSVLNVKAVVAFNQEKALVGAFSVIVQLHRLIDLRHYLLLVSDYYIGGHMTHGAAPGTGQECETCNNVRCQSDV